MRTFIFLIFNILFSSVTLLAQTNEQAGAAPAEQDFAGTLTFLASDWMEGREAGARGGFMAADYIASLMQSYGLVPLNDLIMTNQGYLKQQAVHSGLQRYFQDFKVLQYNAEKTTLAQVRRTSDSYFELQLSHGSDFEVKPIPNSMDAEASLVFAGYGISDPGKGYDDYKGLTVKDQIVVVLDGFPGHADTASPSWKLFGKSPVVDYASMEKKLQTAAQHGAIALVVVSDDGGIKPHDPEYALPEDTTLLKTPVFSLGQDATNQLFSGSGIILADFEKRVAADLSPASAPIRGKRFKISVEVKLVPLDVRNVLGMIRGRDSIRSIIIGAHYDHLGMRNGLIYNGADDNASGTAGMLALARLWSEYGKKPACNIIFAAWTAEEKGLLGSTYFVRQSKADPEKILLTINMDMISRSAPEDTARKVLSIGTMTGSDRLKKMAGECNQRLKHPFQLDLWDVTGHTGSDYGSFIAVQIPVMTFFSGFHNDYHTPRDVAAKVDFEKMKDVLELVNGCIQDFAGNPLPK